MAIIREEERRCGVESGKSPHPTIDGSAGWDRRVRISRSGVDPRAAPRGAPLALSDHKTATYASSVQRFLGRSRSIRGIAGGICDRRDLSKNRENFARQQRPRGRPCGFQGRAFPPSRAARESGSTPVLIPGTWSPKGTPRVKSADKKTPRRDRRGVRDFWRRHPDSNRGCGFCKPVPYHLAMPPVFLQFPDERLAVSPGSGRSPSRGGAGS